MFQPLVFYLEFLDLASRLLIDFALSPSVFKACFTHQDEETKLALREKYNFKKY